MTRELIRKRLAFRNDLLVKYLERCHTTASGRAIFLVFAENLQSTFPGVCKRSLRELGEYSRA